MKKLQKLAKEAQKLKENISSSLAIKLHEAGYKWNLDWSWTK